MVWCEYFICLALSLTLVSNEKLTSSSSNVIPLYGKPEEGYCMDLYLGTPEQKITVVVDTGSSNFAVSGSSSLTSDQYFDTESSTTYTTLDKTVSLQYVDSGWSGNVATDKLKLCSNCSTAAGKVNFTVIETATNFFIDDSLWQGILGLAFSDIIQSPNGYPMTQVLDDLTGTQQFTMTLCGRQDLNPDTGIVGSMEFVDSYSGYTMVPLVRAWYYQVELTEIGVNGDTLDVECYYLNQPLAFLDSGTTNLILTQEPYIAVHKAITAFAKDALEETPTESLTDSSIESFLARSDFLCVPRDLDIWTYFPTISLSLAINSTHDFSINVPSGQYVRQTVNSISAQSDSTYCYNFGIEYRDTGIILGAVFLEGLDVIHDRGSKKAGFKLSASCSVIQPAFEKKLSSPTDRSEDTKDCLKDKKTSRWVVAAIAAGVVFTLIAMCLIYWVISSKMDGTIGGTAGSGDELRDETPIVETTEAQL